MWQIALNHDTCFHALTLEPPRNNRIAMLYTRSSISKLFLGLEFHLKTKNNMKHPIDGDFLLF